MNEFSEGAVTTEFGREFHTSTTRFGKTLDLTLSRDQGLKIFRLLPLVDSSDMLKNSINSVEDFIDLYHISS